jgi:hypothetical protein
VSFCENSIFSHSGFGIAYTLCLVSRTKFFSKKMTHVTFLDQIEGNFQSSLEKNFVLISTSLKPVYCSGVFLKMIGMK